MKKAVALWLVICLVMLSGCEALNAYLPNENRAEESVSSETENEEAEQNGEVSENGPEAEHADAFPMTVLDQAGREVTFEKMPETIVSGYYISTSAIIALGIKDKLVGIEAKAGKRNIYRLSAPELIDLPNVGSAKEFDLEGCMALDPDLAILPLKLKDAAETLEEMGIKVLLVNPESKEEMQEMIRLIAKVTGTEERAEDLEAFTAAEEVRLSSLAGDRPVVYMTSNSDLLATAGKNMYQSDMITLAGGTNAAEEIEDTYWANVSYEQILVWNPDVILLAAEASFSVEDVLNDPALQEVNAVQNGKVYLMPADIEGWDSPVPGAVLGSVYLASLLYDEVTEEEYNETVRSFYETFYGFDCTEE